ncbi:MAG: alpha/beta hydrolase [Proteobacteria bacterium]|nr:alpha/beta hydrolase [Pseudomonadota bacterium]MCP4917637.1 alpha/beta hydrolase [Pseudomonadota bacterium]
MNTSLRWVCFTLALLTGCAGKHVGPSMTPADTHSYRTDDGWEMELRHYPSADGAGPAVVLMHGMSVNHYNWDFRPEVSLADHLASEGFDVWVPSLRGDQNAVAPDRHAARDYCFDDHARYDAPAALSAIREKTGQQELYWVGHSMGGILLYTQLATDPDGIAAGVSISGPATLGTRTPYSSASKKARFITPKRGHLKGRALLRLAVGLGLPHPVFKIFGNPENMDHALISGVGLHAIEDLSFGTQTQVGRWLVAEDIVDMEGEPWVAPDDTPVLVLAGVIDHIAPHDDVAAACQVLTDCEFVSLSADAGFSADYGHIDPLFGTESRAEIYPLISDFLVRRLIAEGLED